MFKEIDNVSFVVCTIAAILVKKTFENFRLDECPEEAFSTYIFGLIDAWFEAQGKDKKGIEEFLDTIKRVGAKTYEVERRRKNV